MVQMRSTAATRMIAPPSTRVTTARCLRLPPTQSRCRGRTTAESILAHRSAQICLDKPTSTRRARRVSLRCSSRHARSRSRTARPPSCQSMSFSRLARVHLVRTCTPSCPSRAGLRRCMSRRSGFCRLGTGGRARRTGSSARPHSLRRPSRPSARAASARRSRSWSISAGALRRPLPCWRARWTPRAPSCRTPRWQRPAPRTSPFPKTVAAASRCSPSSSTSHRRVCAVSAAAVC
mmetsp:Transcript_44772/g.95257  ORF Transcript_44772/g.95257 Transcript_44772/m.95257 type:complete len:235 (-) Transcript_44772:838-1542(-)